MSKDSVLRPVTWMGDNKKQLKKMPEDVQDVLDIGQTEVSHLMNARYHRFSESRLMAFLNKLDRKVTVQVSRRRKHEPLQEVVLV